MKSTLPLAIAIALIAFVYVEVALNFTFHWATDGDLGNGLALPSNFHFVVPAAFVAWGMFFALGANGTAARNLSIGNVIGSAAALVLFLWVRAVATLPDFWGISLGVAVLALVLVMASSVGDWFNVPAIFTAFASCLFWWIATGLDGWATNGGGVGNSVAALGKPATAGFGAFGGVISTPYGWVAFNTLFTLMVGVLLGMASVRLAALFTPKPAATPAPSSTPRGATPAH